MSKTLYLIYMASLGALIGYGLGEAHSIGDIAFGLGLIILSATIGMVMTSFTGRAPLKTGRG